MNIKYNNIFCCYPLCSYILVLVGMLSVNFLMFSLSDHSIVYLFAYQIKLLVLYEKSDLS